MTVTLDKADLISLVRSKEPAYSAMEHELVKPFGSYIGGHADQWKWGPDFGALTEQQLWDLYCVCRDSWC